MREGEIAVPSDAKFKEDVLQHLKRMEAHLQAIWMHLEGIDPNDIPPDPERQEFLNEEAQKLKSKLETGNQP